jgi:hypothetical protein
MLVGIKEMLAGFRDPLRALLFTLGGAFLAWLWVDVSEILALVLLVLVFVVALSLQKIGEGVVTTAPDLALRLMETRLVSIGVLTAASGALGIIITVEMATDATGYDKQFATVVSGALVAFIAGITFTADKADAAVGKYIAKVFMAAYVREGAKGGKGAPKRQKELKAGSIEERALGTKHAYGLTDWSYENRRLRLDYLTGRKGRPHASVEQTQP